MKEKLVFNLENSIRLKKILIQEKELLLRCKVASDYCINALKANKKIFFSGNGGSAADAQHLSAELSGRFYYDRPPLNAEALHVNTSYLTAVANDYGYDLVYARLIEASCDPDDVLIVLTTSGNSKNILQAVKKAKEIGVKTIGFTGQSGGEVKNQVDCLINVPSEDTPRIQELHMLIGHTLCETIESTLFPKQ